MFLIKMRLQLDFMAREPLLNMKLVKETIAYIESLNLPSLIFNYNTTTNAYATRPVYGLFGGKEF